MLSIGGRLIGWFLRLVLLAPVVASYSIQSCPQKQKFQLIPVDAAPWEESKWTARRSKEGHPHEHSGNNTLIPKKYPGGSLDMRCSRRESCSRVLTPAFIFKAPGLFVRCCVVVDAVFKSSRTLVHPEVLKPSARIPYAKRVQMTSSRVRLGQSFKTVGCGCTSCWGDVGAGSVEADVFYIPFIVSVQYIGY